MGYLRSFRVFMNMGRLHTSGASRASASAGAVFMAGACFLWRLSAVIWRRPGGGSGLKNSALIVGPPGGSESEVKNMGHAGEKKIAFALENCAEGLTNFLPDNLNDIACSLDKVADNLTPVAAATKPHRGCHFSAA